jgi:hypothetical protein
MCLVSVVLCFRYIFVDNLAGPRVHGQRTYAREGDCKGRPGLLQTTVDEIEHVPASERTTGVTTSSHREDRATSGIVGMQVA